MPKAVIWLVTALMATTLFAQQNVRIKDVAHISGVEDLQLYGYGLVVGLDQSGDRYQTIFTEQSVLNMLRNIGISLPEKHLRLRNVAAVMVTGTLAPFKRKGTKLDITVSSMGDATSLEGGTLILTALQGPDGMMYASAQGPLATGGYDVHNRGLTRIKKNHVLVGRIPDGAIVQREYNFNILNNKELSLSLSNPDFSSALSLAQSINSAFKSDNVAKAIDAATVTLNTSAIVSSGDTMSADIVSFISKVENLEFTVSSQAKVVVNERTGTIVAGGQVRISQIAVSHGSIKVEIANRPEVVQPNPFTLTGTTEKIVNPETVVEEKDADMVVLDATATVSDLAQALNSIGVAPRDVIAILQAIKQAGALQANLVIM
ncbi:MAG: flagellar basal body P-ring protein FlgI [Chitinispirillaceae bacterium]|nr:flagellar basal body P-ring protein FlgI [Chitinispirillaceae bacterium]